MTEQKLRRIKILARIMQTLTFIYSILWFTFALLSGSEAYEGGILAVIQNSPNAIPWFVLIIINIVSWGWERTGGILFLIFGIFTFFFFGVADGNEIVLFMITIPFMISGILSIIFWSYKTRHPNYFSKFHK
ncbi:MAG: hypothetical protein P9L91_06195 [Candidatus Zophobacter franzmannii]|jgi:uncharacterized membrane protein HdeD (DUF308 family)|nr:hypothetical protein [Candidatus Zophobacter franzmannii]